MNYDVSALFSGINCRVVFVKDSAASADIKKAIVEKDARFHYEINPVFGPKKIGPFTVKNKTHLWDILKKTDAVQKNDADFLQRQMRQMKLYAYEGRIPAVLTDAQKERASVLYDGLNGRVDFMIDDWDTIFDSEVLKSNGAVVAAWIYRYARRQRRQRNSYNMIWLTDLKDHDVLKLLSEEERQSSFYSFYTVKDGAIVRCNTDALLESFQKHCAEKESKAKPEHCEKKAAPAKPESKAEPKPREEKPVEAKSAPAAATPAAREPISKKADPAEEQYQEGRKYDHFSGYGLKTGENDPQRAISWYTQAAKGGNLKAQNCLGAIYQYGFHAVEVNMANSIYMYTMAVFNKSYNEATADEDTKWSYDNALKSLKDIMKQYSNGVDIVRRLAGDDAKNLIAEVEMEKESAEYIRKFMEKVKREWEQ